MPSNAHTSIVTKNSQKKLLRSAKKKEQCVELLKKDLYSRINTQYFWLRQKIKIFESRPLPDVLEELEKLSDAFKKYKSTEKSKELSKIVEIEEAFINTQNKAKALNVEGFTQAQIEQFENMEKSWQVLKNFEHQYEMDLNNEILQQQQLDEQYTTFVSKANQFCEDFEKMIQDSSTPLCDSSFSNMNSAFKTHETLYNKIVSRTTDLDELTSLTDELLNKNHHSSDHIKCLEKSVTKYWHEMIKLSEVHREGLATLLEFVPIMEPTSPLNSISLLKEEAMKALAEKDPPRTNSFNDNSSDKDIVILSTSPESVKPEELPSFLLELKSNYKKLIEIAKENKALIARDFHDFTKYFIQEKSWLREHQRLCCYKLVFENMNEILKLQQKHTIFQQEFLKRKENILNVSVKGESLVKKGHPKSDNIKNKIKYLERQVEILNNLANIRDIYIRDMVEEHQFFFSANDLETKLSHGKTRLFLLSSVDQPATLALLEEYEKFDKELKTLKPLIRSLEILTERLYSKRSRLLELAIAPHQNDIIIDPEQKWLDDIFPEINAYEPINELQTSELYTHEAEICNFRIMASLTPDQIKSNASSIHHVNKIPLQRHEPVDTSPEDSIAPLCEKYKLSYNDLTTSTAEFCMSLRTSLLVYISQSSASETNGTKENDAIKSLSKTEISNIIKNEKRLINSINQPPTIISAEEILLTWCQNVTKNYKELNIINFTSCWRSGLGFNAIIHAHHPELFYFKDLYAKSPEENLIHAFSIANLELNIPRLLHIKDVDTDTPDEKLIILYLTIFYETYSLNRK